MLLAAAACLPPAQAADGQWQLTASSRLRLEQYVNAGEEAASPFANEGGQAYDELSLGAERRISPWERLQVRGFGVLNASDYRSSERGLVLESARLFWEKGDARVPFRAELGDVFAFQSARTIQRPLKGIQVELQPVLGLGQHSLQVFAGRRLARYRALDADADLDLSAGASWLAELPGWGAFSLNAVYGHQDSGRPGEPGNRDQVTASLAWEGRFDTASQAVVVEAEYGRFVGDHAGNGTVRKDRLGEARYLQVEGRGRTLPVTWRALYERYDGDYRPAGAAVPADRRSVEGHLGWRFDGMQLGLRLQSFRDGLDTAAPVDTFVQGASLTGTFYPRWRLAGGIDLFHQSRDDQTRTAETWNVRVSLSAPLAPGLNGRLGLHGTHADSGLRTAITRQMSLGVDWRIARIPGLPGWQATLSPGLLYRQVSGPGAESALGPSATVVLTGGAHTVRLTHSTLLQDARLTGGTDNTGHQTSIAWTWTRGRHRLGIDADLFVRDPNPGASTEAWRFGGFWSVSLERPPAPAPRVPRAAPAVGTGAPLTLTELAPGTPLGRVEARLRAAAGAPLRLDDRLEWTLDFFARIDARQRLIVYHRGGEVSRAVVIVEPRTAADTRALEALYETVRNELLRRYGSAALVSERGAFAGDLAEALTTGAFRRTMDWRLPGAVLRLGIPPRPDRRVRIEVMFAREVPGPGAPWGAQEVQ